MIFLWAVSRFKLCVCVCLYIHLAIIMKGLVNVSATLCVAIKIRKFINITEAI